MARMRRSTRYEKKINHRQWYTSNMSLTMNPATNINVQTFPFAHLGLRDDDATLLRTRGVINVSHKGAGDFADLLHLVVGFTTLPAKFSSATAANLPNPLSEQDSDDWFVWQVAEYVSAGTADSSNFVNYKFDIDSKAMRKMDANTVVVPIIAVQSPLAAFKSTEAIFAVGALRVLVGY